MKRMNLLLAMLFLSGPFALSILPVWGAEGVISKEAATSGNYCHMKFPAIREGTLSWNRPVLKDTGTGDIIDFYGLCNYDPLGKEAVRSQKLDLQHRRVQEYLD